MRSKKELRKNSDLGLLSRVFICFLAVLIPFTAIATPTDLLPSASYTLVDDPTILRDLGLGQDPVWCYNSEANSILITAPKKERALCELTLRSELSKQRAQYDLEVSGLRLRIKTMETEHDNILKIKEQEILKLEEVAVSRPNNYWYLFLAAGIITGVVSTLAIVEAVD